MNIDVTSRTDGIPDLAKTYARDKVARVARIFDRIGRVRIALDRQKSGRHHTRVIAHLDSGATFVAEGEHGELRRAIEHAARALEGQVRREKERLLRRKLQNRGQDPLANAI